MITAILLTIIYLAFISLGLPDSLFGVTWPAMRADLGLPLEAAAPIAFTLSISTFMSSLLSGHIINKLKTGLVVFLSCLMTAIGLIGFSIAPSYIWFFLFAIPLGFGAGSIDTALNNYVAVHFKAHHMNWLHSFWGVGATAGPLIMALFLGEKTGWRLGYRNIGFIQLGLTFVMLICLPLWKRHHALKKEEAEAKNDSDASTEASKVKKPITIPGVKYALTTFIAYCLIEGGVGLWGSTFLIETKDVAVTTAARWIALYYGGIATGRFVFGFISFKLSNRRMIQIGINILTLGVLLMLMPLKGQWAIIPLMLIGFGLAPIFPSMIHETPKRFGKANSATIIGYQIASATFAFVFFVPIIGLIIKSPFIMAFPIVLAICTGLIYFCTTRLNIMFKEKHSS